MMIIIIIQRERNRERGGEKTKSGGSFVNVG